MSIVVPSQFATSAAVSPFPPVLRRGKSLQALTEATGSLGLQRAQSAAAYYGEPEAGHPTPKSYAEVAAVLNEPGYVADYFNTSHYRVLVTLESAMDFLAVKLAYRIEQGDIVRLNVRRTLGEDAYQGLGHTAHLDERRAASGDAYDGLDHTYDVRDTVRGSQGCVVHRLLPRDGSKDIIVLFRGTQRQKRPSGLRANMERRGAGHSAYAEVARQVEGWVEEAHAAGQHVNIAGHSLGGAIGLRLLAALPPAAQARCSVFGAQMPKSWPDVVARIENNGSNMFGCINPRDLIAYGGKVLPAKARIVCAPVNGWKDHCVPGVASQEFNRQKILLIPYKPSVLRFVPVEMARVFVGMTRGGRFPF